MRPPILVTGCARSGTSMVAGVIAHHGAFGGETTGATRYNKKGQFENKVIRDRLVKPYLRQMGWDPLGQRPLPEIEKVIPDPRWRGRVEEVFKAQGYSDGPWYYKGAKMCLVWPLWHAAFPDAKWIVVRRETKGIVRSCLHTGFMRAYRDSEGWEKWVNVHLKRFEEMKKAGLTLMEVWPSKAIQGDLTEVRKMMGFLDLPWRERAVKDFIEPRLWHNKGEK